MIVLGIGVAAVAAFVLSSVYYSLVSPIERRAVGAAASDRGGIAWWQALTELLRTTVTAAVFAWVAGCGGEFGVADSLLLALVLWAGFPLVLLTGSVLWEKVPAFTAAMHAGDWLLKLLLIAVVMGLLH